MTLPCIAYVSLWLPKPSETFIFREVKTLTTLGLPVKTFNLYAPLTNGLSPEMSAFSPSETLGIKKTHKIVGAFLKNFISKPSPIYSLLKKGPLNKWRSLEGLGENLWALMAGIYLAGRFKEEKIEHIHAPWANGPATAAWVASKLTDIPFSFAARAGDIYPPEGALPRKIADAAFVRVNYGANIPYLQSFAPNHANKITLVYNALSLTPDTPQKSVPKKQLTLLAAGRFVGKKGFNDLLEACSILKSQDVDFTLTLAGDGFLARKLKRQTAHLGLTDKVSFPGFLRHHELSQLMLGSSALVVPSVIDRNGDRDGIPNVIMEAYAHGIPVIATDVAGISEVVINKETGYLVEQHNPAQLAQAMHTLAKNQTEACRLATNGNKRVLNLFDQRKNSKKLIELFTSHAMKAVNIKH